MDRTETQDTVLKVGGAVCARPGSAAAIAAAWNDRQDGSARWLIVHGGGPQLDQALDALEGPPRRVAGLRITSAAAAQCVRKTLDLVGADLAAALRAHGVPAIHVSATARAFSAQAKGRMDGQDLGRVGTVVSVDTDRITTLVPPGHVAVVTPVGWDRTGPLNVNADEGALALAEAVDAARLVLATDVQAVRGSTGEDIPLLVAAEARLLLETGTAKDGMVPKLRAALDALDGNVDEVRIGSLDTAWKGGATRILSGPEHDAQTAPSSNGSAAP